MSHNQTYSTEDPLYQVSLGPRIKTDAAEIRRIGQKNSKKHRSYTLSLIL